MVAGLARRESTELATQNISIHNYLLRQLTEFARPEFSFVQRTQIFREISECLYTHQISRVEFISALREVTGGAEAGWLKFIQEFENSDGGFLVLPPEQVQTEKFDEDEPYQLIGSVISDAAQSSNSILLLGQPRTGKSTAQRSIMAETLKAHPFAEFLAVDLQTTKFMELQRTQFVHTLPYLPPGEDGPVFVDHEPNTVTQITAGKKEHMLLATEAIKKVWNLYEARAKQRQEASRCGPDIPEFHLFRLFVNEWNTFYEWADEYGESAKARDEFKADAQSRGIKDPLYPTDALKRIGYIFRSGAELNISVCLAAQEYTADSTGLSSQMQACATIIGIGRIDPLTKMGGYNTVNKMVRDSHKIGDADTRAILGKALKEAIKQNIPVLLSTQGACALGVIPDYKYLESASMMRGDHYRYQHPVI